MCSRIKCKSAPAFKGIDNSHSIKNVFVQLLAGVKKANDLKLRYKDLQPLLDRTQLWKTHKNLRTGGGDAVIEDVGKQTLEDVMLSLIFIEADETENVNMQIPQPSSKKTSKKRTIGDMQGEDDRTNKLGREPSPVAESISSRSSVGIQAQPVPTVFDWNDSLETLGSLITERKELVRRLAEVDRLVKEVMQQGCQ